MRLAERWGVWCLRSAVGNSAGSVEVDVLPSGGFRPAVLSGRFAWPVNCCCVRDGALPEKLSAPTDALIVSTVTVPDRLVWNVSAVDGVHGPVIPARSGPRLQILLCVWRC